jgi:hypothetical protein
LRFFAATRQVEAEGQVLARLVRDHRLRRPCRPQHERGDHRALADLLGDHEVAPAGPAAVDGLDLGPDRGFAIDQDVGQEPVGLAPGGQDLVGRGVAQHVLDRAQQGRGHERIVLGQDVIADMLLGDALDHRQHDAQVVDVLGVGQHRPGQGLGLGAAAWLAWLNSALMWSSWNSRAYIARVIARHVRPGPEPWP